jgi:hypothetical protein
MTHSFFRRLLNADFQNLLDTLTTRQHLNPHEPVGVVLGRAVECLGVCPNAIAQATQWLALDPSTPIGRLRRTELTQLARSVHRFWRQAKRERADKVADKVADKASTTH